MQFSIILLLIILIRVDSIAQTRIEWLPADLNVQPFTANFLEQKAGFQYLFDIDKVRIDIGTSRDIVKLDTWSGNFSFGADFFTYTRARSEANFKFPVETIDYLFGVNVGYVNYLYKNEFGTRLRFSHISAHLVDGYYNSESEQWLNKREPFVFSKEFLELIVYYKIYFIRFYGGMTYNVHVIPNAIKKSIFQVGFDYYPYWLQIDLFTPFIAYDFKLTGINNYSGNNIISVGIKFAPTNRYYTFRGFSILASYFSGKSVHGEFYNVSESYTTIGFNFDI